MSSRRSRKSAPDHNLLATLLAEVRELKSSIGDRVTREIRAFKASLFDAVGGDIARESARPLMDHWRDYVKYMASTINTKKHNRDTTRRVRFVMRLCRAKFWAQLTPAGIQVAISKLQLVRPARERPGRKTQRARKVLGLGLTTINHYIHSFSTFAQWMVDNYRAERSPCRKLQTHDAQNDIRHGRRALNVQETIALIKAARTGRAICGIPGEERAHMYLLASTTGLRASELESLNRSSFTFDAPDGPTVVAEGRYTKSGKQALLPVRADVAAIVRRYLELVGRDVKLFRRPKSNGTRGLRLDLEAAGIPYRCVKGLFADFHSLRHTFITNLFDSGATPKEAQTLARHQDPRLTLGRYAHVTEKAQRAAVERLGALSSSGVGDHSAGPAPFAAPDASTPRRAPKRKR